MNDVSLHCRLRELLATSAEEYDER
jgi:hypothetical protein